MSGRKLGHWVRGDQWLNGFTTAHCICRFVRVLGDLISEMSAWECVARVFSIRSWTNRLSGKGTFSKTRWVTDWGHELFLASTVKNRRPNHRKKLKRSSCGTSPGCQPAICQGNRDAARRRRPTLDLRKAVPPLRDGGIGDP